MFSRKKKLYGEIQQFVISAIEEKMAREVEKEQQEEEELDISLDFVKPVRETEERQKEE